MLDCQMCSIYYPLQIEQNIGILFPFFNHINMDKQPIFVVNCCDLIITYSNTLEERMILMTCLMQLHFFYATKKQLHKTSVVALDKSLISIFLLVIYVDFYTTILVMARIKYYMNFFYHFPTSI